MAESHVETVVIVSIDTTRRDHLSVYGYPLPTTPHLEALAKDGVIFDQAIAVHTNTAPSHASILTGLEPPQHGSINNAVPIYPDVPTLAETLAERGFATAAFVSGQTLRAESCGLDRGFSLYDDRFEGWERRAEATVDLANRWLATQDNDRSLFLFVHLFDPHFLYSPPGQFRDFGLGEGPPRAEPRSANLLRETTQRDTETWRQDIVEWTRRYDGEIAYADWAVGHLLQELRRIERYSSATIIVVSDHGETLAERPRVFDHGGRVTEEQIRVPLIIKFPDRVLAGARIADQVSQIDIVPTILGRLHLPAPEASAGIDLHELARNPDARQRPLFIMARREPKRLADLGFPVPGQRRWDGPESMLAAVRLPPYKLVDYAFLMQQKRRRLRDLVHDPTERSFDDEPEVVSYLSGLLDQWWRRTRPDDASSGINLDPESVEMLRALGYLEATAESDPQSEQSTDPPTVFESGFEDGIGASWSASSSEGSEGKH